jgi:Putative transposase
VTKVIRLCERLALKERAFTDEQLALAAAVNPHLAGGTSVDDPHPRRRSAFHRGFSLHPSVSVHKNDRQGFLRLCRYGLRPPFSLERMSLLPSGEVAYRMKRALPDGTKTLELWPIDFLRRVASQVAPRRSHLVHYHGLLAPHARDREHIAPPRAEQSPAAMVAQDAAPKPEPAAEKPRPRRLDWASLLGRVYGIDILTCNRCGNRRRIVAAITTPSAIERILTHLGLAARPPPTQPARRPQSEQLALSYDPCADPPCLAD